MDDEELEDEDEHDLDLDECLLLLLLAFFLSKITFRESCCLLGVSSSLLDVFRESARTDAAELNDSLMDLSSSVGFLDSIVFVDILGLVLFMCRMN